MVNLTHAGDNPAPHRSILLDFWRLYSLFYHHPKLEWTRREVGSDILTAILLFHWPALWYQNPNTHIFPPYLATPD